MASPLGHLAAGAAVWYAMRERLAMSGEKRMWQRGFLAAAVIGLSLLPDGDAVLGVLFGDFDKYHNNWTHSVFWIPIIGILTGFVLRWVIGIRWRDGFRLAAGCVSLHLAMDYATVGRGVMLLWPLSAARFQSPVLLFYGLEWSQPWNSPSHLMTLVNELAWIGLGVCAWIGMRSRHVAKGSRSDPPRGLNSEA